MKTTRTWLHWLGFAAFLVVMLPVTNVASAAPAGAGEAATPEDGAPNVGDAAIAAETAVIEAEHQAIEAERSRVAEEQAALTQEIADTRGECAAALPWAFVAWLVDRLPVWPLWAAALVFLLLLIFRPGPTVQAFHPGGIGRLLRQAFARSEGPSHAGLRMALVILVVVLTALFTAKAFAASPAGGVDAALGLAREAVHARDAVEQDRVALERLRGHDSRKTYTPRLTKLPLTELTLYAKVVRDSFEHLYCLTAVYLEQNKLSDAVAAFRLALEAPRKGNAREYQKSLSVTIALMGARGAYGEFPGIADRAVKDIDRALLLIRLSEAMAAVDAQLSERLLAKARTSKRGLEDTLALLGWEKRRGTSDEAVVSASVAEALKQITKLRTIGECADVVETAQEAGFPDVAQAALRQALSIKVKQLGDVEDIVRIALGFGYKQDAAAFVGRALDASTKVADLLAIAQYATERDMPAVADAAIQKAIDSGRTFADVFLVVQYVEERGDQVTLAKALERALDKVRTRQDGTQLADFTRGLGMEEFADRALLRSVVVLRDPRSLLELLAKAVQDGKLSIAAEAAGRYADDYPTRRVAEIPVELAFPAEKLAPGTGFSPAALAGMVDLRRGELRAGQARLEPLLPELLDAVIFGELRRMRVKVARRYWNDFSVLVLLYADAATKASNLTDVLKVIEPLARIPRVAGHDTEAAARDEAGRRQDQFRQRREEEQTAALTAQRDRARAQRDQAAAALAAEEPRTDDLRHTLDATRLELREIRKQTIWSTVRFGAVVLFALMAFYAAFAAACWSAAGASRFKAYVFAIRFVEMWGWIFCATLVGIPAGLMFILIAQALAVLVGIHENTRETFHALLEEDPPE